jgi:hypothetical protein
MRKVALVLGTIWLLTVVVAATVFLVSGQFPNVRGLMYALIGAAIPGFILAHWGLGKRKRLSPQLNPMAPKAPYDRAAEAGHVMRIDPHA